MDYWSFYLHFDNGFWSYDEEFRQAVEADFINTFAQRLSLRHISSIVPGRLGAVNYDYEWEFVYSTGSSTNSNNTLQGGKVSFNVTDLTYNISYNANGGSGADVYKRQSWMR